MIDSESELVYAPEAGFTQPERAGRRYGIEWNNFYRLRPWLVLDADAAWSHARHRIDPLGEGRDISDAIQGVASADGSVFSRPSFVLNGQLNLPVGSRFGIGVDVFNLLDRQYEDITYYFPTRIRDPRAGGMLEAAQQPDFVTHPGEPRTARVRLRARF
jgi:outer membrane receptor protein involved in Fe transport